MQINDYGPPGAQVIGNILSVLIIARFTQNHPHVLLGMDAYDISLVVLTEIDGIGFRFFDIFYNLFAFNDLFLFLQANKIHKPVHNAHN
ncbi:hypothetical protein D3C72_2333810 [compost metagenome]